MTVSRTTWRAKNASMTTRASTCGPTLRRVFTLLHKGKDDSGPVIGAGIIYIKREQLMGLIPTFRATNTSSVPESLKVLADFDVSSWVRFGIRIEVRKED